MAKLKVYVTPIGFHDAYVAAPSQKAALEAWGSAHNLFARGVASIVEDPALAAEPLASPGKVIKRLRGTAAEQIAALPPDRPGAAKAGNAPATKGSRKPPPLPSRAELDAADAALADAESRHKEEEQALERQISDLRQRLAKRREAHAREAEKLQQRRDAAETAYQERLRRFRAG